VIRRSKRLWPLLAVLLLLESCASSPEKIAYTSLDAAVTSVQAAMRGFNEFYKAGKATEAQRTQVLAAYAKFQAAVSVAIDLSRLSTGATIDMKAVSEAATDLVYLISVLRGT